MITIKCGLDLPIAGQPRQEVEQGRALGFVAVLGTDYPGLQPRMHVRRGDLVRRGEILFEDTNTAGVFFTAPAAGRISAINRSYGRKLLSVVIAVAADGGCDDESDVAFKRHCPTNLSRLHRDCVQRQLIASGEWTALRTRPFGKVPRPDTTPHAIFVQAMDTNPLAGNPDVVIGDDLPSFRHGLAVLGRLTDGPVWVCRAAGSQLPTFADDRISEEFFAGPHPAGNPGTHIHFLFPVDDKRTVWVAGYQDVIAIGRLFTSGRLHTQRVVSLAGPQVIAPRLIRTHAGASLLELTDGELAAGDNRIISGSVLNGTRASTRPQKR